MPDALMPIFPSFAKEIIDQGISIPLDDLLKTDGKEYLATLDESDLLLIRANSPDGKIRYLPGAKGTLPRIGMIRQDWLDRLGLKMPKTRDELVAVYRAFRDRDPNGNGLKDEIPVSGRQGLRWCDDLFVMHGVGMFEGYPQWHWDAAKKQLVNDQVSDQMKMALLWIRSLIAEGLMDKTMPIQSRADWVAKINSDQVGHYFHQIGDIHGFTAFTKDHPERKFVYFPLVSVPGVPRQKNFYSGASAFAALVITRKAERPEKIMQWFNWGATDEGLTYMSRGIEGYNWKLVGGKVSSEGMQPLPVNMYLIGTKQMGGSLFRDSLMRAQEGPMQVGVYDGVIAAKDGRDLDSAGMPETVYEGYEDFVPSVSVLYQQYASKFVLGEVPVDSWDAYVKDWMDRGGKVISEKATAWYKKLHNIK
jgi:putative aldouronate transport system substrate-binding protein